MSNIVKEIIHEPLTCNKVLHFFEAIQQQKTIHKEYDALVENHTWDIFYILENQKVFKRKQVYKIKRSNKDTISRYKIRWFAKSFKL